MSFECGACKKSILGYRRRDFICNECRDNLPAPKLFGFKLIPCEDVPMNEVWIMTDEGVVNNIINIGSKNNGK
jgi:hypothetical protein